MAFARLADIKALLGFTDNSKDALLQIALDAAEEWIREVYQGNWDALVDQTVTFYDIRQGSVLYLPDPNPSNVTVTVFLLVDDPGTLLFQSLPGSQLDAPNNFEIWPGGRLKLMFNPLVAPVGLPGAVVRILPLDYDRVIVTYTPSGVVPAPVRWSTMLIAAANLKQFEFDITGFQSEHIGDYSYTRGMTPKDGLAIPDRARRLMRPFSRRPGAIVVP